MENLGNLKEIEAQPTPAFDLKPIRHGLRARAMMLKGENRRDFNNLCDSLELEWLPRTPTEQFYLEQMAVSQWKLQRMQIVEYDAFFDQSPSAPGQLSTLERLIQCQIRLERSYSRAQHDLQRLQKTRPHPAPAPHEPIVFTPDPPRETDPPQPGPTAQVIDISTAKPATTPDDQPPAAAEPRQATTPPDDQEDPSALRPLGKDPSNHDG